MPPKAKKAAKKPAGKGAEDDYDGPNIYEELLTK